jgi:hypothetical protein
LTERTTLMGTDTPSVHPDTNSWVEAVEHGYYGERTDPFPDSVYVPGIDDDFLPTITAVSPNHGTTAGGTELLIEGTSLYGPTVTIGGAQVAVGEQLPGGVGFRCVTAPGPAGPADIVITTLVGTVTETGGYEYEAPVPPTVTSIYPVSGLEAGGESIQLVGTGMLDATFAFGTAAATIESVYADGSGAYVTSPPGTGVVDVSVTSTAGTGTLPAAFTYTSE